MRLAALLLLFAPALRAAESVDRCASPRRLVGRWEGVMKCTSGEYPASFVATRPKEDDACIEGDWKGEKKTPGSLGFLRASTTATNEVFLLTSGQMSAILTAFEGGRRLSFAPDPNAGPVAQLIRFGGNVKLDKDFKKAFVRYSTVTPISPLDSCQGTMRRAAPERK